MVAENIAANKRLGSTRHSQSEEIGTRRDNSLTCAILGKSRGGQNEKNIDSCHSGHHSPIRLRVFPIPVVANRRDMAVGHRRRRHQNSTIQPGWDIRRQLGYVRDADGHLGIVREHTHSHLSELDADRGHIFPQRQYHARDSLGRRQRYMDPDTASLTGPKPE